MLFIYFFTTNPSCLLSFATMCVINITRVWQQHADILCTEAVQTLNLHRLINNSFVPCPDEKVMADDEFTCDLFRFLQLLCEGHNNGLFL